MKHKELMMRLTALGMSTTMLCFSPATTLAMDMERVVRKRAMPEVYDEDNAIAVTDENGFVIEDGELIGYEGTAEKVVIPDGVTSIGIDAFAWYSSLTEVVIPDTVTEIMSSAFYNCTSLTKIVIPDSVTFIGGNAFSKTKWLEDQRIKSPLVIANDILIDGSTATGKVVIPDTVKKIAGSAFGNCSSLTEIVIPNSVTDIGDLAFNDCSNLTKVVIPESVTSIQTGAFWGCSSLTEIIIPKGVTSIANDVFRNCSSLTKIVIPDGVTKIANYMLFNCSNLTEVVIPNSITSIEHYAFSGCSSLTSIKIPESVTSIHDLAFGSSDVTIHGYPNSYAQTYATEHNIPFVELKKEETPKNPSSDVAEKEYYYNPVLWAVEKGVIWFKSKPISNGRILYAWSSSNIPFESNGKTRTKNN